jgi:streptogramin lyase
MRARVLAFGLLALGLRPPIGAAQIHEFNLQSKGAGPSIVMPGSDGSVWVALARVGRLGRFVNGELREFPLPDNAFPVGIALDPSGPVWYSDVRRNVIGKLDPSTAAVREYALPGRDVWPFFLVRDGSGRLWFTERVGNAIGMLNPETGEVREYPVPVPNSQPAGLTITPSGRLYFTENSGNRIGVLEPATGALVEYAIPTKASPGPYYGPAGITSDARGNVWFAELDGRLGRIAAGATTIEEFAVPYPAARPAGIVADVSGLVWFTELDGNAISSFHPESGTFRRFPLPTGRPDSKPMGPPEVNARGERPGLGPSARSSRPFGIAIDREGRVWFSEQYGQKVGHLTPPIADILSPAGVIRSVDIPIRILTRTGTPSISVSLDDREIPLTDTLDVAALTPGAHTLAVRVGEQLHDAATSQFVVEPSLDAIVQMARRLQKPEAIAATLSRALAEAREGRTDVSREIVRSVLEPALADGPLDTLVRHLRHYDLFGQREYGVFLDAHGLQPRQMTLEVGDAIVLANTGSEPIQVNVRDGDCVPEAVNPGGQFTHRFTGEGTFDYEVSGTNLTATGSVVVKTRTTYMVEFPMVGPGRVPTVLDLDRDGHVWFTAGGGGFSKLADIPLNNKIGRLKPDGVIDEFETPSAASGPTSLKVSHSTGEVFFTERGSNRIGRLNPKTRGITEHEIPTKFAAATGLDIDPRSNRVWFSEKGAAKIGVLDPATGTIVEYPTPNPNSEPSTVALDEDGLVWFDERNSDTVVRFDPATARSTIYRIPTARSRVVGITPDKKGHVYFLELGGHKIGKLTVSTGQIVEYAIPTPLATPFKLTIDPLGRVWFTEVFGNKVGVLHTDGTITEFALPTRDAMPGGITVDRAGNVWFTEQAANRIVMIPLAAPIN